MQANTSLVRFRKLFIMTGYSVIFAAFAIAAFLYFRDTTRLQTEVEAHQKEMASRFDKKVKFEDIDRNVKLLTLQVRKYDRLVPSNQDLGTFLGQLSHELDDAGIKEVSKACLAANNLGKSQELPIEVSGTCSFPQFHLFLFKLEHLNRLSSVSKLSIEADSAMTGTIHVQMTVRIYNTKPA